MAKNGAARDDARPQNHMKGTALRRSPAKKAEELDRLIHERLRLGIVSALAVNDSLSFSDLKKLMNTTDGNLSVHAGSSRKLSTSPARNRSRGGCRRRSTVSRR
ncbi:MAG TPA: transcriptional regulator [Gemmatimonadaceae bacterium]|nr:transcriptional regulator [Gemmatimonadaceae bacterium]